MLRKTMIGAVLLGATLMGTGVAHASTTSSSTSLRVTTSDTGSVSVQRNVADSPADPNSTRIKLAVAEQTGDDYVVLSPAGRTNVRGPIEAARQLRFDVRTTSYVGAGAPRISVDLDTDGNGQADLFAYLSAAYCQQQIGSSDWAVADFNTTATGCAFYASDGVKYSSDGTHSAWAAFAAAHPGARVLAAYVVMDEVGQSFIDRIAIGNMVWNKGLTDGHRIA